MRPPPATRRAIAGLACLVAAVATVARAQPPAQLPAGALEDQFGRSTDLAAWRGRAVIVLAADRGGFDALARWAPRLRQAAPASVQVVTLADLRSAPRLLRGVIRGGMPKDTAQRVLLDWSGILARPIRGERQPLVAAVYGAAGTLVTTLPLALSGEDDATVQALVRAAR